MTSPKNPSTPLRWQKQRKWVQGRSMTTLPTTKRQLFSDSLKVRESGTSAAQTLTQSQLSHRGEVRASELQFGSHRTDLRTLKLHAVR
jgi:hypothetical protein